MSIALESVKVALLAYLQLPGCVELTKHRGGQEFYSDALS